MKIIHIFPPTNIGPVDGSFYTAGMIKSVWLLDKFLTQRGHQSYIPWSGNSKIHGNLIPVIEDLSIQTFRERKVFKGYYDKIFDIVNNNKFDIVHHHMSRIFYYGYYQPNILTLRLPFEYCKGNSIFLSSNVPFSTYTAALTKRQAEGYTSNGFHVDSIVNNGIDLEEFSIGKRGRNHLLVLARILPDKGQHIAIEVAKKSKVPLIIAGDIWDKKYYEEKVKPHIDGKFIQYVGPVPLEEKVKLYQSAVALIVPVQWEEPFNLTIVEAMACGTPVIGINKGSIPEIITDNKTGFVVNNYEEMAEAVKKVYILDPNECRRFVENNFDVTRVVDKYEKIYESLVNNQNMLSKIYPATKVFDKYVNGRAKKYILPIRRGFISLLR